MNTPVQPRVWMKTAALCLVLFSSPANVTSAGPPRTKSPAAAAKSAAPAKSPLEDGSKEAAAVISALEKSAFKFTPGVKSAFLAWSKALALAEIAKSGQSLPVDFLNWVDSEPVVAGTIYGIADNAAQRLVLLRSLEIDLGSEEVRNHHLQLALAMTDAHARLVDPPALSNPAQGISLADRGPLKLEIKRHPCVRVDTRAKDRPLDMNDHIINFLEDHPVTVEKKVVREVDGRKVETIERSSRPVFAYEVYGNPERVKQFNDYMTGRGFKMELDCGKGQIVPAHWGGGRDQPPFPRPPALS